MHRQLSPTTVKNITSFTYLPVSIDSDQLIQNNAIGTCAIGSSRASNAGILDCVVVKQCALAEAGRGLGRTLDCPRRAFVAACVAICFGGFPLFVEVGIDVAFFARFFALAVLVLAGWAGGACPCCAAVLSDIATLARRSSLFSRCLTDVTVSTLRCSHIVSFSCIPQWAELTPISKCTGPTHLTFGATC